MYIYSYIYILIYLTCSFRSVLLLVEVWVWCGGRSSSTLTRRIFTIHLAHWSSLVITDKRLRFPHPTKAWHDGVSQSNECDESEIAHSVSQSNPQRGRWRAGENDQESVASISITVRLQVLACSSCSASVTAIPSLCRHFLHIVVSMWALQSNTPSVNPR